MLHAGRCFYSKEVEREREKISCRTWLPSFQPHIPEGAVVVINQASRSAAAVVGAERVCVCLVFKMRTSDGRIGQREMKPTCCYRAPCYLFRPIMKRQGEGRQMSGRRRSVGAEREIAFYLFHAAIRFGFN